MLPAPYYRNSNFTLYLGDCIPLLQELPEERASVRRDPGNAIPGGMRI